MWDDEDPLAAARGILTGIVIALVFWGLLALIAAVLGGCAG